MGWIVLEVLNLTKMAVFFDILLIISNQFRNVFYLHLIFEVVAHILTHVGVRLECVEQPHCVFMDWLILWLKTYLFEICIHVLVIP